MSCRKWDGRLFNTCGLVTVKLLAPKVLCVRGTTHSLSAADRWRRRPMSETRLMSSAEYAGTKRGWIGLRANRLGRVRKTARFTRSRTYTQTHLPAARYFGNLYTPGHTCVFTKHDFSARDWRNSQVGRQRWRMTFVASSLHRRCMEEHATVTTINNPGRSHCARPIHSEKLPSTANVNHHNGIICLTALPTARMPRALWSTISHISLNNFCTRTVVARVCMGLVNTMSQKIRLECF